MRLPENNSEVFSIIIVSRVVDSTIQKQNKTKQNKTKQNKAMTFFVYTVLLRFTCCSIVGSWSSVHRNTFKMFSA